MQWDAQRYLGFERERTQPAVDLAARIALDRVRSVLDVGCGPGNSTAVVGRRFPEARITGCDSSPEMLAEARRRYPGYEFILCDAGGDLHEAGGGRDVVFSNACLQWIPDHPALLPRLMGLLREGGVLAVQIPYNFNEPIHNIIRETAESERWRGHFPEPVRSYDMLTAGEYFDILSEISPEFDLRTTTYMHALPSHEAIMDWYRGTGLRPYLQALGDEDRAEFEREVEEGVRRAYPKQRNGEVIFPFPRLFFTVRRQ